MIIIMKPLPIVLSPNNDKKDFSLAGYIHMKAKKHQFVLLFTCNGMNKNKKKFLFIKLNLNNTFLSLFKIFYKWFYTANFFTISEPQDP